MRRQDSVTKFEIGTYRETICYNQEKEVIAEFDQSVVPMYFWSW